MMEGEELPSAVINAENCMGRIDECRKYLKNQQWIQFSFLFRLLVKFCEKKKNVSSKVSDELSKSMTGIQDSAVEYTISQMESVTSFEDFQSWLLKLNDIVQDKKVLWDLIHTKVNSQVKATLRQSHEIAASLFTPSMLFEFGIQQFLQSSLCDTSNIANEEALIDIFYAIAGYVRACALDNEYETSNQGYIDFLHKLFSSFVNLPDFDAHRFVWLIEAVSHHLHISSSKLKEICGDVLKDYVEKGAQQNAMNRLYKLCVISTSPFMKNFVYLKNSIERYFQMVLVEQRAFVMKYIFSSFATLDWSGLGTGEPSEQIKCWKLYLMNLSARLSDRIELPNSILVDFLEDSVIVFEGYYGEIQPSKSRATDLRLDIFTIVELVSQNYPLAMSGDLLKRLWYLLLIVAVSGASTDELESIQKLDSPSPTMPFLGLERSGADFVDYGMALGMLSRKFEDEAESFQDMITFVRKNFD